MTFLKQSSVFRIRDMGFLGLVPRPEGFLAWLLLQVIRKQDF